MIARLILISGLTLSSSLWSEVAYLSCEDIEKNYNTSLAVDTDTSTVKIGGGEARYTEYGNTIVFQTEGGGNQSFFYSFDRVAGTLQEQTYDRNDELRFVTNYKCTRTNPLF